MRWRGLGPAVLVLGLAATLNAAETTRWVERQKVDVRAGRGSFHEIVDTMLKGDKVSVLATESRWLSVRTPRGKTGWVFEAALAAAPVEPGGGSDFLKALPGDAATSRTAASQGAKGIYAQNYAREKGYDYGVVEWVESHQPSSSDFAIFDRESGDGR